MKNSCNLSADITPDMICQIINYGKLCNEPIKDYLLADTRKEIAMKIHDYWKEHSEILYQRCRSSLPQLHDYIIRYCRLQKLQQENIRHLSYMIKMMNNTKKGEIKQ